MFRSIAVVNQDRLVVNKSAKNHLWRAQTHRAYITCENYVSCREKLQFDGKTVDAETVKMRLVMDVAKSQSRLE